MLVEFDFAVTQTAYVKAAMDEIPAFRPDGLTPAQVQALVDGAAPVREAYVTKKEAITSARALRHTTIDALHDASVDFSEQGRSRFRKDPTVSASFVRLPKQDQTFQETITRATASEALWETLPLVGTPPAAFTVAQGTTTLSLAGFTALITAARTADGAIPAKDQDFQNAEGDLHEKQAELEDFVAAALEQGRSQFAEGTSEREVIDAIPNVPPGGGGGPTPEPLTAPQNLTLTPGDTGTGALSVDCEVPPGATGLQILQDNGGEGTLLATLTDVEQLPYTLSFPTGDSITLFVKATRGEEISDPSSMVTATAP